MNQDNRDNGTPVRHPQQQRLCFACGTFTASLSKPVRFCSHCGEMTLSTPFSTPIPMTPVSVASPGVPRNLSPHVPRSPPQPAQAAAPLPVEFVEGDNGMSPSSSVSGPTAHHLHEDQLVGKRKKCMFCDRTFRLNNFPEHQNALNPTPRGRARECIPIKFAILTQEQQNMPSDITKDLLGKLNELDEATRTEYFEICEAMKVFYLNNN